MTFQGSHQTEDGTAESRLSGPVGSDDPHELAGLNLERDIFECHHTWESKGGMIEVNDRGRVTGHVVENSSRPGR
jgi:hypothetical protein